MMNRSILDELVRHLNSFRISPSIDYRLVVESAEGSLIHFEIVELSHGYIRSPIDAALELLYYVSREGIDNCDPNLQGLRIKATRVGHDILKFCGVRKHGVRRYCNE